MQDGCMIKTFFSAECLLKDEKSMVE